jgi:hypothetical protein
MFKAVCIKKLIKFDLIYKYRWTLLRVYYYNEMESGLFFSINNDISHGRRCLIDTATFNLHFKKI